MSTPSTDLPQGLAGLRYPITQISLAVRDMDVLLERYHHAFGWAPWQVFDHQLPLHHATELRGEKVHYAMLGAEVYVGAMNFELLQPYEGPNLWSEHIDAHGEGIASIATMFQEREDGDAVKAAFRETFGIEVINRAEIGDHIEYYYLDTQERFGCLIESGSGHAIDFVRPVRVHPHDGAEWVASPASGLRYRIGQVTLVVHDLQAAMEAYHRAFGWGPWHVYDAIADPGLLAGATWRGRPADLRLRWAQAQVGEMTFEIVEPADEGSPWGERLARHGEGLTGISVPMATPGEVERVRRQFADEGIGILASARIAGGPEWSWLDTEADYRTVIATGSGTTFADVRPSRVYPER